MGVDRRFYVMIKLMLGLLMFIRLKLMMFVKCFCVVRMLNWDRLLWNYIGGFVYGGMCRVDFYVVVVVWMLMILLRVVSVVCILVFCFFSGVFCLVGGLFMGLVVCKVVMKLVRFLMV